MSYPKFLYHSEMPPQLVESDEEAASLGEGWAESPADHGVITAPSVEQAREIARDEANKNKELADTVEEAVAKKKKKAE